MEVALHNRENLITGGVVKGITEEEHTSWSKRDHTISNSQIVWYELHGDQEETGHDKEVSHVKQ